MVFSFSVDGLEASLGVGYYILVYAVGAMAMALSVFAYQMKRRVSIILGTLFGQICWVLHFLLQGDLTSAVACALTAIMLAVYTKRDSWNFVKSKWCIVAFILLISGFSILSFAVWSDIFPVLAGIFAVIANSRSNEKSLRLYSLLFCAFWLLNSIFKLYPIALANDAFCVISAAVSLYRYRKDPSPSTN